MVEAELDRFLTSGEFIFDERMYYTLCYLTLTPQGGMEYIVGGRTVPEKDKDSNRSGRHKSFQQVIDYPLLAVSENQRLRFKKAMRVLDISPHYHLSELEPCVGHPFKDKVLADLCRCARTSCPAPYTVREDFEAYTKEKNKGQSYKAAKCPAYHTCSDSPRTCKGILAKAHVARSFRLVVDGLDVNGEEYSCTKLRRSGCTSQARIIYMVLIAALTCRIGFVDHVILEFQRALGMLTEN